MTQQEPIPLAQPMMTEEMVAAASEALRHEFLVMGESVHRFEEEFARYCGTREAVSVSNGTIALQVALQALGVGPGDSVLTTPMSFIATANAIHHQSAVPAFHDVDARSKLLAVPGPDAPNPKAVIPVHLYGTPCPVEPFRERFPDVPVVEDACQAHGARLHGRRAGALGDVGCFSFYSTKNMTVGGDGGMVTTDDPELAAIMRSIRDCGRDEKYLHGRFGHTARLNTVNAAIGRVQLHHLDKWNRIRRTIAARYDKAFSDMDWMERPQVPTGAEPVSHLYAVGVRDPEPFQLFLAERCIHTGNHYPLPIHLQPPYRETYGGHEGQYPEAERWARETVSLPLYVGMDDDQVTRVLEAVEAYDATVMEVVR